MLNLDSNLCRCLMKLAGDDEREERDLRGQGKGHTDREHMSKVFLWKLLLFRALYHSNRSEA